MTASTLRAGYSFGAFQLQPGERRLLAGGKPVAVGPRAFDLLLALVQRPGQLVPKEELLERAWPNLVVEPNNLQVQISALRKILGRGSIATISGRGYRFTLKIADDDRAEPSASVPPRTNLPHPLTSFVGRQRDLDEWASLLADHRLLTLTGIGGCGKTRLAIKLAERMLPSFPDGVWFVDLAPVAEPDRVALATATALGVREDLDKPLEETLKRHLAGAMLLVLDNCEHLVETCAALVNTLLVAVPGLHVLATSREGLGLGGERIVRVPSLGLPAPAQSQDPGAVLAYDAVRLFVERARLAAPQFALSAENTPAVVEICRRLDGIPIAIELAAVRIKLLSPEQIRARLDDRFRLLAGGSRAISRHQTLLATLQWSYEHLTAVEQRLFRHLAVFAGGFTLAAATAVSELDGDEIETLEQLDRLVYKSLVVVEREADEPRYRMLETVRQYAEDRLNDSDDAHPFRDRHLAYFVTLARTLSPMFFEDQASTAFRRVEIELPNFLAAHNWCDHTQDGAALGLELAANLRIYWLESGAFALGQKVYLQALARDTAAVPSILRAQVLFALAQHEYMRGHFDEAIEPAEAALQIALENGDQEWAWRCTGHLGRALGWSGDFARAGKFVDDGMALARRIGNPDFVMMSWVDKLEFHRAAGQFDRFAEACEQVYLAYCKQGRPRHGNGALTYAMAAHRSIFLRDFDQARDLLEQAIHLGIETKSDGLLPRILAQTSHLLGAAGNLELAARLQGATDAAAERMGGIKSLHEDLLDAQLREKPRTLLGAQAYAAAYNGGHELSLNEAIALALASLAAPRPLDIDDADRKSAAQ